MSKTEMISTSIHTELVRSRRTSSHGSPTSEVISATFFRGELFGFRY